MIEYKGWQISYNPKPIPARSADFDAFAEDYDGAPDSGDTRNFTCVSIEEAKAEIDFWIEENELHTSMEVL